MSLRESIAAAVVALAMVAGHGGEASGQPRPPGPPPGPPGGMRPPGPPGPPGGMRPPVFGPIGGAKPPGPPMMPGGGMHPPGLGLAPGGGPKPGGPAFGPIGGPVRPGGPLPPGGFAGPGGIGGPGGPLPPGGFVGPGGPLPPGGFGGPGAIGQFGPGPGLGGLDAIARSSALAAPSSTAAVSQQALANLGNQVRNNFNYNNFNNYFSGDWYKANRNAWRAERWANAAAAAYGAAAYGAATWGDYAGYSGYGSSPGSGYDSGSGSSYQPFYYDYGSNVVYDNGNVYHNGESVGTQEQYAEQAMAIADAGKRAKATEQDEWLALGVFAMVQGKQTSANDLFQLAVNTSGAIRGNYYNALSNTTLPIYGSVDKKTQRSAWTVGDSKEPVFEAGIANLTKSETTMVVHLGKDRTQQWMLVRIKQSAEQK